MNYKYLLFLTVLSISVSFSYILNDDALGCPCGCNLNLTSQKLMAEIYTVNANLLITSGYRCQFYNNRVGGSSNSSHLRGDAVDISIKKNGLISNIKRYELTRSIYKNKNLTIIQERNHLHVQLNTNIYDRWVNVGPWEQRSLSIIDKPYFSISSNLKNMNKQYAFGIVKYVPDYRYPIHTTKNSLYVQYLSQEMLWFLGFNRIYAHFDNPFNLNFGLGSELLLPNKWDGEGLLNTKFYSLVILLEWVIVKNINITVKL